jgi:hypothetical protein
MGQDKNLSPHISITRKIVIMHTKHEIKIIFNLLLIPTKALKGYVKYDYFDIFSSHKYFKK